jgi:hypothetical protein
MQVFARENFCNNASIWSCHMYKNDFGVCKGLLFEAFRRHLPDRALNFFIYVGRRSGNDSPCLPLHFLYTKAGN